MLAVFKKHFSLFKGKSPEQVEAIIKAFKIDPQSESIDEANYCRINEVANCRGENEHIVSFVGCYLPFNEYGEMDKASLAQKLSFLLNDING